MNSKAIEVVELSHSYPSGVLALSNISFYVAFGESVAVVGANGAGKSTLLRHFNGNLLPAAGTIRISGRAAAKENLAKIRLMVGMVFQDSDDQLFMPTVFDDVAFGPLNMGLGREEIQIRVKEALKRVNIENLRDRAPHTLSGGEKRAAAIAAVLAMGPDILVMDEPSSNLDPRMRRGLIGLLRSFGHTKIIATHDLDLAMELCPRAIVLREGRLWADGPTMEIFEDDSLLEACGLEKPLSMQGCPFHGKKAEGS